jgi:uncharacterized protein (TIGR02466 family)
MPEIIELFPTPLYRNSIEVDEETKHRVMNLTYDRYKTGLFTHTNVLEEPGMGTIKAQIFKELDYYIYEYLKVVPAIEYYITTSWVMKHVKDDYTVHHCHTNSIFSGVVYISVDQNSGGIKFTRDAKCYNLWPPSLHADTTTGVLDRVTTTEWTVVPKNGDVLIWPSHLVHEVHPNLSDIERYALAFNVYLKGTFGGFKTPQPFSIQL